jgi:hypothetical protein
MFLAERGGYEGVPLLDAELRKRTFWCGYIVQMSVLGLSEVAKILTAGTDMIESLRLPHTLA